MPRLGFTGDLARELSSALVTSGEWRPFDGKVMSLIDPTLRDLQSALVTAFEEANRQRAILLLGFIGHGISMTGPPRYFFLTKDSPSPMAGGDRPFVPFGVFNLSEAIGGLAQRYSDIDGLIVLVDACEAGGATQAAARDWSDAVARSAGRLELLVASDEGPAYRGCFTRSMLDVFGVGLPRRGEYLLPADLRDPIANSCTRQLPQAFSMAIGEVKEQSDPGLWLVRNVARTRDVVHGRADAATVDELTTRLHVTTTMRRQLNELSDYGFERLRGIVGVSGSGKSVLMGVLVRPGLADTSTTTATVTAAASVDAAVFLTGTSTATKLVDELVVQLRRQLPAPAAPEESATEADRDHHERDDAITAGLHGVLSRFRDDERRVTVLIDGLDLPSEPGWRAGIARTIGSLTTRDDYDHLRLIVSAATDSDVLAMPEFARMRSFTLTGPSAFDIRLFLRTHVRDQHGNPWPQERFIALAPALGLPDAASGTRDRSAPPWSPTSGWLVPRLVVDIAPLLTDDDLSRGVDVGVLVRRRLEAVRASLARTGSTGAIYRLGLLVAVVLTGSPGPVLPIEVVCESIKDLGPADMPEPEVRNLTVALGALLTRRRPSTPDEHIGVAHVIVHASLTSANASAGVSPRRAHRAVLSALERCGSAQAAAYREVAAVRHYLAAGDPDGALAFLQGISTGAANERIALWESWLPSFTSGLGPYHPITREVAETIDKWAAQRRRAEIAERTTRLALLAAAVVAVVAGVWIALAAPTGDVALGLFEATTTDRAPEAEPAVTPTTEQVIGATSDQETTPPTVTTTSRRIVRSADQQASTTTTTTKTPTTMKTTTATKTTTTTTTADPPECPDVVETLQFGAVPVGGTAKQDVSFVWRACYDASKSYFSGTGYSIDESNCPLAQPDTSCMIRFAFTPAAKEKYDYKFAILDKKGNIAVRILLRGTGK